MNAAKDTPVIRLNQAAMEQVAHEAPGWFANLAV